MLINIIDFVLCHFKSMCCVDENEMYNHGDNKNRHFV